MARRAPLARLVRACEELWIRRAAARAPLGPSRRALRTLWFRILNPERQRERFDADGSYCRRWLPEWGTDAYPEPMVDLATEAADAKKRFKAASR
jgi:hypothetical protein